jgi:hypothetical protein
VTDAVVRAAGGLRFQSGDRVRAEDLPGGVTTDRLVTADGLLALLTPETPATGWPGLALKLHEDAGGTTTGFEVSDEANTVNAKLWLAEDMDEAGIDLNTETNYFFSAHADEATATTTAMVNAGGGIDRYVKLVAADPPYIAMNSPDGTVWYITVDDTGALTTSTVEP